MGMEDSRASSAKNSRRRRWEVKTKESFETSLAVEIENSPKRRESTSKYHGKDDHSHPEEASSKEKSSKAFEDKVKTSEKQPTKTILKPSSATSKTTGSKSARSKPSSARSKPSSAKSTSGSKVSKTNDTNDISSDNDLLSAKLGALIEEANAKSRDPQRRSAKEKEKNHIPVDESEKRATPKEESDRSSTPGDDSESSIIQKQNLSPTPHKDSPVQETKESPSASFPKNGTPYHTIKVDPSPRSPVGDFPVHTIQNNPPGEVIKVQETPVYSDDPPKYSERDNMMYLDDSSPEPSAPPLSSVSPSPEWLPKKKKTKKKKSESQMLLLNAANEESFISLQLKELKDDVVDVTRDKRIVAAPGLLRASSLPTVHGNINAVFQERIGGFVMTRQGDECSPKRSERFQDPAQVKTRTTHAVFLQSGFRTFSVLCQGLLAGLTLAHSLLIFLLETDPSKLPLLYNSRMTHIFYTLIIFLTTICFTAACDRCDLSGVGVLSGHGLKIPWTPAFYLSSLVLSLIAIRTEDVLAYGSLYEKTLEKDKIEQLVEWWRWICVARSSTAVLAWVVVVPDPHTDALLDSIEDLNKK